MRKLDFERRAMTLYTSVLSITSSEQSLNKSWRQIQVKNFGDKFVNNNIQPKNFEPPEKIYCSL